MPTGISVVLEKADCRSAVDTVDLTVGNMGAWLMAGGPAIGMRGGREGWRESRGPLMRTELAGLTAL